MGVLEMGDDDGGGGGGGGGGWWWWRERREVKDVVAEVKAGGR